MLDSFPQLSILSCALVYLVLGLIWGYSRWTHFLSEELEHITSRRDAYLTHSNLSLEDLQRDDLEPETLNDYIRSVSDIGCFEWETSPAFATVQKFHESLIPRVDDRIASLAILILFWPAHAVFIATIGTLFCFRHGMCTLLLCLRHAIHALLISLGFQRIAETKFIKLTRERPGHSRP
jgi:hypothetical protein